MKRRECLADDLRLQRDRELERRATPFLLLTAFVVVWFAGIAAGHAQLTDDVIRRLGGDPDADRARAAKNAREAPSAEFRAMRKRMQELAPSLTDAAVIKMQSNDPLLLELYKYRFDYPVGRHPWFDVIDRDLYRRPEAKDLMMSLLSAKPEVRNREGVLNWISEHTDLWWSVDIMEEAIRLFHVAPNKWESSDIGSLCVLVSRRGDEKHLPFTQEIQKLGVCWNDCTMLERRLKSGRPMMPFNFENFTPNGYKSPLPRPFQPRPKEFQVIKIDEVIKHGSGDGAAKAKDAMEAFLKTWNPIGRSAQELTATFGKPSEERTNAILYSFDTGNFAWNFEFVLLNGKVVELKRPPSE